MRPHSLSTEQSKHHTKVRILPSQRSLTFFAPPSPSTEQQCHSKSPESGRTRLPLPGTRLNSRIASMPSGRLLARLDSAAVCHHRRTCALLRPRVLDRLTQFDPKLVCHEVHACCGFSVCCVCLRAVWTRPIRSQC